MRRLLAIVAMCLASSCLNRDPSAPSDGACTGQEVCGTAEDCPALCATVERLGCAAQWGIDADDGACLELCRGASPGLCPAIAARQETCADIDRATECQR